MPGSRQRKFLMKVYSVFVCFIGILARCGSGSQFLGSTVGKSLETHGHCDYKTSPRPAKAAR